MAIVGVTVVAGLFASVRPAPEQRALWSSGAFEYAVAGGPDVRPGYKVPSGTSAALEAAGATSWDYLLMTSMEFQGQSQSSAVLEADWASLPMGASYVLESGRWPTAPGEAAVTSDIAQQMHGTELVAEGGAFQLEVVGTGTNQAYLPGQHVLTGRGTWEAIPPEVAVRFPDYVAGLTVLWNGSQPSRVVDALGFSPSLIDWYRPPDTVSIAMSAQVAMGGLGVMVFLVTALGSLGQARSMRPSLAVARAIGLNRGWLERVLREQAMVTFVSAFGIAAVSQLVLLVALGLLPPLAVVTPWAAVGVVSVICLAGLHLAPRLALTQLRVTEREL